MRHQVVGNRLGRNSSLRKATLRDLAKATLIRQRICTTRARAKEARKLVDRLITLGKKGTLAHKRIAFSILGDHHVVSELFQKIATRFQQRNGGYTRIIALAHHRRGDDARLVYLELVEKDQIIISNMKSAKAKSKKLQEARAAHAHAGHAHGKAEGSAASKAATTTVETTAQPTKEEKPRRVTKKDDDKSKKSVVGGIKKMFQRKTGGE